MAFTKELRLIGAAILLFLVASIPAKADYHTVAAGWQAGDAFQLSAFCLSREGADEVMDFYNLQGTVMPLLPPGCHDFPAMVPFVLKESVRMEVDWEGDIMYTWVVRDFYRQDIYVLLWDRPEMPMPDFMLTF